MATQNKHVVFDVVGTCVSYDAWFDAIEARIGDRLKARCIGSRIFGYAWLEAAEREYTYLSVSGKYVQFFDVFRSIFYRTLWQAGIEEPRKFASDEDREFILAGFRQLKPREGIAECFDKLRAAGYTVWALTAGDTSRVAGYLKAGGIDFPAENFASCDSIGIGKPAPESYQYILNKFPKENQDIWFAAAHMWDSAAARRCGFKGAWASIWEKETCSDIYGDMEVVVDDLPALADGIIAYSAKQ